MSVAVEKAAEAWCTGMTNGMADGQLTLADINGLSEGTVTPNAQKSTDNYIGGETRAIRPEDRDKSKLRQLSSELSRQRPKAPGPVADSS